MLTNIICLNINCMQNFDYQYADQNQELLAFMSLLHNRLGEHFIIEICNGNGIIPARISITNDNEERIRTDIVLTPTGEIMDLNNMLATANPDITNINTVVDYVQNGLLHSIQALSNLMHQLNFYRWCRSARASINAVYAINYRNAVNNPVFQNLNRFSNDNAKPFKGG